ncbi:hypothetical protein FACUT_9515 [Fusarium acutatum]|uniref:Uncharacterized protein n=1 Tax=Fusarium acutatum TaxID=78861 RepID=A0A8H4JL84_9HYPO|nr:hypothetical protein FACUT_9515 [Fusarium acutatum]
MLVTIKHCSNLFITPPLIAPTAEPDSAFIQMVDIERGQSDLDPYSLSMEEFRGKIRKCQDASIARSRVQSVLNNYNQMRPDMPKAIQLEVARFLRHEKWVDSPRTLSQFRLYHMLVGQGRTKFLNFSAWLVVAAIWPSHLLVIGIADEMSRLWGQKFPDTRPFFPKNVSEEEALLKYDGNFVPGDEYPLSDAGDGNPKDNHKEDSKRKSNSGDIFDNATKKHKVDRTTALPNSDIPEPSNEQKTPGAEGPEQGRVSYLKSKIKARDELISEKDEIIKQQDAQIKKLERQRDRRFKDGDKDFRRLFNRVEALKTNLKDATEKEHDLQSYVRQLEDQIKNRDEEIEKLSDRNRKLKAKNQDEYRTWETFAEGLEGDRGEEIKELIHNDRTLEAKVKEPSDTEEE